MTTNVAVVGASGKLGGIIADVVESHPDFALVARLGSDSSFDELDGADIVVDATTPSVSANVVQASLDRGAKVLVGTSGWSSDRITTLSKVVEASDGGVFIVPNFSLGSAVGTALAAAAARLFPSIEIVESHRETKVDSPSGTAVRTAELLAEARNTPVQAPHVDQRARGQQVASVPVHSLRRPGVIARQEVLLSGPGETLTITHDTTDPAAAYAPGIVASLEAVRDVTGVIVGLENVIDLGIGASSAASA